MTPLGPAARPWDELDLQCRTVPLPARSLDVLSQRSVDDGASIDEGSQTRSFKMLVVVLVLCDR